MLRTFVIGLAFLALVPSGRAALRARASGGEALALLSEARTLLEDGKKYDALAKARLGLEYEPDNIDLLDVASRAAQIAGVPDEALWLAALALDETEGKPDRAALAEEIKKRLSEIDTLGQKNQAVLSAYSVTLLALGQDCANRRLYVNAVELLSRCRGTSAAVPAEAALNKIYGDKKAVEALLESGMDVPLKVKKKRSAGTIAKEDKKHETWENAWQIKGDNYTIVTDMGIEMAESMSLAMERMNGFYRKLFHVKEHGGGQTARVTIKVYRSRADFDAHETENEKPVAKEVKGFFVPGENRVSTYDPREEGWSLAFLWSTLFHESSHQFTHLISADTIPGWLNEGTASYFEGARLLGNGTVEANLVAEERLAELAALLAKGSPTLKEVVSFYEKGSYEGDYYPFGWGLVYFLHNYENDKSERLYLPLYRDYMAAYKSGGKHDVLGRFVEYFITKAKQPGVASFEDFEKRFNEWIKSLHELYFGPPEKADLLVARARKQIKDKQYDSAIESYRWALRKRPTDALSYCELADALAGRKEVDAAIFNYEKALESARSLSDPKKVVMGSEKLNGEDLIAQCQQRVQKLGKEFSAAKDAADGRFIAACAEAAQAYAEKKLPLSALRLLDDSRTAFGASSELARLRERIAKDSGADTRRWRRLPIDDGLESWDKSEGWEAKDGGVQGTAAGPSFCCYSDDIPERFRFEARLQGTKLDPARGLFGLAFGVGEKVHYMGLAGFGLCEVGCLKKGEWTEELRLGKLEPARLKNILLALEISPGHVEFFIDGESAGQKDYEAGELAGAIGLLLQGGGAQFSDIKIRY